MEHTCWFFDTAREAEYTPQLAKALATTVLESIAGQFQLPSVSQASKRLKLSHFLSIAAGKQPSKMTSLLAVPEFSHFLVMSSLPNGFAFDLLEGCLQQCTVVQLDCNQFFVP